MNLCRQNEITTDFWPFLVRDDHPHSRSLRLILGILRRSIVRLEALHRPEEGLLSLYLCHGPSKVQKAEARDIESGRPLAFRESEIAQHEKVARRGRSPLSDNCNPSAVLPCKSAKACDLEDSQAHGSQCATTWHR